VVHLSEKKRIKRIFSAFFLQEFPADLALVIVWLVTTMAAIYLPILSETPIRIVLAFPTILFIPGYCFIAALFPKADDIGLAERIMLSIGTSIAIVPLIGLGLNFTPWGIRLEPIMISLTFFTYVMIFIAYYQRAILPVEERFRISFSTIAGKIKHTFMPPGERGVDRFLSLILIIFIVMMIIATVYVIVSPKEDERFTEFYILGENQTSENYPVGIIIGQNYPMYIGIGNHENRDMIYSIETWTVFTEFDNTTNTSRIITMDPRDHLTFTLANNKSVIIPYNLSVKKTGYNSFEFLLFNESVPSVDVTGSNRINASYRNLHLWINVGEER
jgi:uncharacterized membrane protein